MNWILIWAADAGLPIGNAGSIDVKEQVYCEQSPIARTMFQ